MTKNFSVPRGTTDILPEDVSAWRALEDQTRQILSLYNYHEVRTPLFEETDLFARSMGQTSDVVQKQMLGVQSQRRSDDETNEGGNLSLRPEGTASIVRAYIQHNLDKKEALSKLFYVGPMFRGERPQKGRLRQFHQIGVEAIGPNSASPLLDAEIIALSVDLLKTFGIQQFQIKLNTLGSKEDKENFAKSLREELKSRIADLCSDCQSRFDKNVFRVLDCKNKSCISVVDSLEIGHSYLSKESEAYFTKVRESLDLLNIPFVEAPRLVRGLDYYTHTVFEITSTALGSQDALGAGGRYNHLVSQLGGPEVDAIGFALGMERILLALPAEKKPSSSSIDAYLIALDEAAVTQSFKIVQKLREAKISADMAYRTASMKSQMRSADKLGAKFVVIIGENELKNETVTVKEMATGEQKEIAIKGLSLNTLIQHLRK